MPRYRINMEVLVDAPDLERAEEEADEFVGLLDFNGTDVNTDAYWTSIETVGCL